MLSQSERKDVRRHLNYGAIAYKPHDGRMSTGFWPLQNYELEKRLDQLAPVDEASLTGDFYGSLSVISDPLSGDTLTLTVTADVLSGGPEDVLVTAASGDTKATIAQKLAAAINGNANLKASGFQANVVQETFETQIRCSSDFDISVAFTGDLSAVVGLDGQRLKPDATMGAQNGQLIIVYGYLNILNYLESAQAGATDNLDTAKADVWTHNANEIRDRKTLYQQWQRKLSQFLDVPINTTAGGSNRVII